MEFIRLQTLHCLMIIHRCADDPEHSDQNLLDSYSWMQEDYVLPPEEESSSGIPELFHAGFLNPVVDGLEQ